MNRTLIHNAFIVNEGKITTGDVLIENGIIKSLMKTGQTALSGLTGMMRDTHVIDATGQYLLPGIIDVHVHFREPGLMGKGDISTESKAAVAGGVTSVMDMPNTLPPVLTRKILEEKYRIASEKSLVNFSFYMGVSDDNLQEVLALDTATNCGVKAYLGTTTGNLAVTNRKTLEKLFSKCRMLIAAHCEDEEIISYNIEKFSQRYGENIPVSAHPQIRSAEACVKSTAFAIGLAKKYGSRLHIAHLSTAREAGMIAKLPQQLRKKITAETCVHYLWFCDDDYKTKGVFIRWNPSIKKKKNRQALLTALLQGNIDLIASDHAPHTKEEKQMPYMRCPSGAPMVQHMLVAMLEFYHKKKISLEKIVEKMCHAPARCFSIEKRGFIRTGYYADLTLVDLHSSWKVNKSNILYKCGWSPLEGETFRSKVTHTFVNGNLVFENDKFYETHKGERLKFNK